MKHLILPIASSPYEGAHQSAIIVPPPSRLDLTQCPIVGWVYFEYLDEAAPPSSEPK